MQIRNARILKMRVFYEIDYAKVLLLLFKTESYSTSIW